MCEERAQKNTNTQYHDNNNKGTKKTQNEDGKQTKSIQSFRKQTMSEHEQNNKIEWNNAHARTLKFKWNQLTNTHIDIIHTLEIKSIQIKTFFSLSNARGATGGKLAINIWAARLRYSLFRGKSIIISPGWGYHQVFVAWKCDKRESRHFGGE